MPAKRVIPDDRDHIGVRLADRLVNLTNLQKPFFKQLALTKGDLLQYYLEISHFLLPHLIDRPMVMKRYPNGAEGKHFFMKRAPSPRPKWIQICDIRHRNAGMVNYPVVQDLPTLMWIINLGCIDLNPWYGRCDDVDRPDYLHFDLDPVPGADFGRVREVALLVRDTLESLGMRSWAKTTGSRGIHVYVPIRRDLVQKEVWTIAKAIAKELEARHPKLVTAEYRKAKRPRGRINVDYNQNAWGRTLASVYSVRPTPEATVSMPVNWEEVEAGVAITDFNILNTPGLLRERGDLWKPLLGKRRFDLRKIVGSL